MAASVVSLYPRVSFVVNFRIEFFIQQLIEKKKTLVGGRLCMGGVGNNLVDDNSFLEVSFLVVVAITSSLPC